MGAKVVRLRAVGRPRQDPAAAIGQAMREAQELAGLDDCEAARRLNVACGTSIITAALWRCWASGGEVPDAVTWLRAVRLAGEQAGHILARLG